MNDTGTSQKPTPPVGRMATAFAAVVVIGVVVFLLRSGTTESNPPLTDEEPDGHDRMIRLLAKIRDERGSEYGQLGRASYDDARAELQTLSDTATANERCRILANIGYFGLALGMSDVAVEHFRQAWDLQPQVRAELESMSAGRSQDERDAAEQGLVDYFRKIHFQRGVAALRKGELENCIHCRTGESCILPLRGEGIHSRREGSQAAVEHLTSLLESDPHHLPARWLLNIAHMTLGTFPDQVPDDLRIPPETFESPADFPAFNNIAADVGLDLVSLSGGAIADDFDNDGLLDIVVSTINPAGQLRFYHNNGDGTFADRTAEAGLEGQYGGLNIVHADYDNDGHLDILVLRGAWRGPQAAQHPNSLLRNLGGAKFRDVTFETGLEKRAFPTQTAAWADFDNDGDLDLYVGNENFPCQLFENDGTGHFRDVARQANVRNDRYTKGVVWGDYNNDGLPDLYVSNLGAGNRLYQNLGEGRFEDVATRLNVTKPTLGFPAWFWDFNNDGTLDLFAATYDTTIEHNVAHYLGMPHGGEADCLYQGDGRGGFREVAAEQNLDAPSLVMGANFGDLDNDGYPDFHLGTGYPDYDALVPNLMYRNLGGSGFTDVTFAGRFGHLQKGHGVSFADLDNDGDQDVFIELGGAFLGDPFANALYENPGFGNHWITVRLVGTTSNRCAIGARIRVDIDEPTGRRSIYKWVGSGGSFGGNPFRLEIGLGQAESISQLEIHWPVTGETQVFRDLDVDQFVEITEGDSEVRTLTAKRFRFSGGGDAAEARLEHAPAPASDGGNE